MLDANELLDVLDELMPETAAATAGGPQVTNEGDAEWAFKKIAAYTAAAKRLQVYAAAEKGNIDNWLKSRVEPLQEEIAMFEGLIRGWHQERLAEDPELKTISLPSGESRMRKQQAEYKRDEPTIVDWAKEAGYAKWLKGLDWSALKDAGTVKDGGLFTPDGERVPGVEVQDRADLTHSVKLK